MEKNENLREELNEKDTQNVSGGFIRYNNNGSFIYKESGRRYNLYCDFCGEKIKGRGAYGASGLHACINCYEKLHKINSEWYAGYPRNLIDDELA